MVKVPKGLVEETKAMIRLYFFLRYDCGLKEAERPEGEGVKGAALCPKGQEKA